MKKGKIRTYIVMHILLIIVSLSSLCSKFASQCDFLSLRYCLFQCGMIGCLGIYALGWQQIIKHMDLTTAYANKAVTVIWGLLWGVLIFRETLTPGEIIGAAVVIAGVVLFAKADGESAGEGDGE